MTQLVQALENNNNRMTPQTMLGITWRTGTDKHYWSDGMVQEGRAEKQLFTARSCPQNTLAPAQSLYQSLEALPLSFSTLRSLQPRYV